MAWSKKDGKRSPIRKPLMPQAGDSLAARFEDVAMDRMLFPMMLAGVFVVLAALEWHREIRDTKPSPRTMTVIAAGTVAYAVWRVRRTIRELRDLKIARDGERAVAQRLESDLRSRGYEIFHDIPADGFNIDHLVIGPTGVFVVETKTRRKPSHGSPHVIYDGKRVTVDGWEPDRNPVAQARAISQWLRDQLRDSTDRTFPIRPIVVFPGWFVEPGPPGAEVWVLNDKAAVSFIVGARNQMDAQDRALIVDCIRRHIEHQAVLAAASR